MHGLVALDAAGEVIRPAILWNDQRTAAQCREIEERVGFERLVELTGNRALTGFTAPKLLWLREHEPESYARIARDHAAEGLRAAAAVRRARDRRRGRVGHAAVRRRAAALERRGARGAGDPARVAAARARVRRGVRDARRTACRSRRARATRRRARSASARSSPARPRWCSAPPASCSARSTPTAPTRRRACTCSATRCPDALARDGRDALRRRLAAVVPRHARAGRRVRRAARGGGALGARARRASTFLPYLAGERTPHADPDARGAFAGLSLRHDRGALTRAVLEGVAFGLRDCLDVVRARRRRAGGRPRVGRRRPQRAVAADRRLRARAARGAARGRGGRRLRRGAAGRHRGRRVAPTPRRPSPRACARTGG